MKKRVNASSHRKPLFDSAELALLDGALTLLKACPEPKRLVTQNLERLTRLGELVRSYPSLCEESQLGPSRRSLTTLLRQLVHLGPLASPFRIPVKANLARDFVLAKIQAFRSARLALESVSAPEAAGICDSFGREIAQSIYTLLAEELLVDLLFGETSAPLRRRAGQWLIRFWDDSTNVEVDDFCPLLEKAWRARNLLVVDFGTLMGSMEVCRLIRDGSDPVFMDVFCREGSADGERQAFEEFLFGLLYEQIETLHREMARQHLNVVDRRWVAKTLKVAETDLFSGVEDPEVMFLSYRTRHMAAASRRSRGVPGPHHTAEAFIMLHILQKD